MANIPPGGIAPRVGQPQRMMMRPMGNVMMSPQPGVMRMQGPRFGNRVYNPAANQVLMRPSYGQQPVKKYLRQKLSTKYVKNTIAEPIRIFNFNFVITIKKYVF